MTGDNDNDKETSDVDPAKKNFTQDDVNAIVAKVRTEANQRGRRAAYEDLWADLKAFGIDTKEKLVAAMKSGDEARRAQLSEMERLKEDAKRGEQTLADLKQQAQKYQREAEMIRLLSEHDVGDMEVAELLYTKASASKDFDAKQWIGSLKEDAKRKAIFRQQAATQPAPNTPNNHFGALNGFDPFERQPATTTPGPSPHPNVSAGIKPFNAMTATSEELVAYERSRGFRRSG